MKNLMMSLSALFLLSTSVFASPIVNEAAKQYVQLVLAMGGHDAAYVDAYYGPTEWQVIAKDHPMSLNKIIKVADLLLEVLTVEQANLKPDKGTDPQYQNSDELIELRLSYLSTQLNALKARAKMLSGDSKFNFDQESQALYGTQAPSMALSEFEPFLNQLDKILPGPGDLSSRLQAYQNQFVIAEDKLKLIFDEAIKACRERTKPFIDLLTNENFTLEFVTDKPWSGYNWYKGNGYSLIQVNTDLPIYISRAIDLGCHEGYPGHHTYNSLLEANLYLARGWVEYSVYPLFSPQSLVAEGSANYGIELAFPGDEKIEFEKKVLFPLAGLNPELADQYNQVQRLVSRLNYAGNEVARLYRNGEIDATKAQQLLQKYSLMAEAKAQQRVRFIDNYGAYVINYNWGKDMVKQWIEAGDDQTVKGRWQRFTLLLSTPRLPSNLN